MIQTSFLRNLLKSINRFEEDTHIFIPSINQEILEIIANFLYTGEIISDNFETSKLAINVLINDLGFPAECDVTTSIECPMKGMY